jgi:class 3 adenylate cyclase
MNLWKRLVRSRRKLSIITKFTFAFITLLLLLGTVAITGLVSLDAVQSETEAVIDTGIEVQRLVFKMDAALKNARQLERDFFVFWSSEGFAKAQEQYAQKHRSEIDTVLNISSELQNLLESDNVSPTLRRSNPDVLNYVALVDQYSSDFKKAVGLVSDLGMADVGKISQLEQNATRLRDRLQLANTPELMVLYLEMRSFEKEYLLTRQDSIIKSIYEAAKQLRNGIIASSKLDSTERRLALEDLDKYEVIVKEIVDLNQQILSQIRENIDINSARLTENLVGVANAEVQRARSAIANKIHWARVLLFAAVLLALIVAAAVARQFISALKAGAVEQEKSERLLRNILPEPIAQRLKQEENTIADSFAEVTVMFADIVGFTQLAAETPAIELVEILNVIFSEFDQLADEHGLEKIKTIGDAYMVVGGLPVHIPNHAEAIAGMALDMQTRINEFCADTGKDLSIRIGINTGPVIAGIIGTKKFIYDLWGDTVNIASRMESHGIPGSIQVTEATYKRLRKQFLFEERGLVQVKGRGKMNCYLLMGKKNF